MTRQEIETSYQINKQGIITSPGKFEGEMLYVPYFWDAYLNGLVDDDDGGVLTFLVDGEDRAMFPELGNATKVHLESDDAGFVYCGVDEAPI
jgi:hypothetical protein